MTEFSGFIHEIYCDPGNSITGEVELD